KGTTINGAYATQYKITFAQSGIGGDTTATVVTINGTTTKTAAQLPFSLFVTSGSSVTFAYGATIATSDSDKQYRRTGVDETSPLTVSAAQTITGSYATQYQVTFSQTGLGLTGTNT